MNTKFLSKFLSIPDSKKCLILLVILSIFDVVFTYHFLLTGAKELNFVLSWSTEGYGNTKGIIYIILFKLLVVSTFYLGYCLLGKCNKYIRIGLNLCLFEYLIMTFIQTDIFLVNIKYAEIPLGTLVVLHF